MLLKALVGVAVLVAADLAMISPAEARAGYAVDELELKAGPARRYKTVGYAPPDSRLEINGCLPDWTWCDVTTRRSRGWVNARDIEAEDAGRRVEYGSPWNVPLLSFNLGAITNQLIQGGQVDRGEPYEREPSRSDDQPEPYGDDPNNDQNDGYQGPNDSGPYDGYGR